MAAVTGASPPDRVLVTGAAGYVGANTVARFLADPAVNEVCAAVRDVAAADVVRRWFPGEKRLRLATGELPDAPWDLTGVDVVVHAAAWISLRTGLGPPVLFDRINAAGTRKLLSKAREAGVRRFVLLSTQAVYGTSRRPPWSETTPVAPETAYARSKVAAETACCADETAGMERIILRLGRVYGAGLAVRWDEVVPKFAGLMVAGHPLPVHGGGLERVDLVHIRDVTEAIRLASVSPLSGAPVVLNIGGRQNRSILELAEMFCSLASEAGLPSPRLDHRPASSSTVRQWGMCLDRARTFLGWDPQVPMETGLLELLRLARSRAE